MSAVKRLLYPLSLGYILALVNIFAGEDINDEIKEKLKRESFSSGFSESFDYSVSKNGRIDNVNNTLEMGGDSGARVFLKSKTRPLSILSNKTIVNLKENTITASGEKRIDNRKEKKEICIPTEVRFGNDYVLFADKVIYNFSSQNGLVYDALFLYNDYVIRCQKARLDYDGTFYGENVFFTTCKYAYPSWGFTIKKAVYNKSFILGKGVSFMLLGREISLPIPFIYFFPEKEKTGFVYPTGIWFDSAQGLCIDPGFYFYFGECADLFIRTKWYLGSGSSQIRVKHRYVKQDVYRGSIFFVYSLDMNRYYFANALNEKRPSFESYFLEWENSFNFEFYKNNFKLLFYYDEDGIYNTSQKADFFLSHSFMKIPFISKLPLNHGYNKNFKTKSERWNFLETSISHTFRFLRVFTFGPSLSLKSNSSNEDADYYVRDDNDFDFEDADIDDDYEDGQEEELVFYGPQNRKRKVNTSNFYSNSWKDYFGIDYWKNVWKQTNTGVNLSSPFNVSLVELKWFKFSLSSVYDVKFYGSFLEKDEDLMKYVKRDLFFQNKHVAFIHDFKSSLKLNIIVPDFSLGSFVSSFKIPLSFSYSPSSERMHDDKKFPASFIKKIPFFEIKQPYINEGDDLVSVFSHSVFGNVNNSQEGKLKFGFDFYSYFADGNRRNDLLSFSISGGYDIFADNKKTFRWQNIDINIDAPFFFGFKYSTSINLYRYEEKRKALMPGQPQDNQGLIINNVENNAAAEGNDVALKKNVKKLRKTDKLFWDVKDHFFMNKNFLFHRFSFSFPLAATNSRSSSRDQDGYSRFHILNTFYLSISYNFTYAYNPVKDIRVTFHSCNLKLRAKLTEHWEFFSNLSLRKKQGKNIEYSNSYLGIRRVFCDCWMLYIFISYDRNKMHKRNDFTCVVSLKPLDSSISVFEQRRTLKVGV